MKLAGTVITFNEAPNIERCLRSLDFCDEIHVLDSMSTDETVTLAKKYTPHVHSHPWMGYIKQKNYLNSLVESEWILSIDADEQVPLNLKNEILALLKNKPKFEAYSIARKTFHSGQWIRYGGWYPDRMIRLFNKKGGQWAGSEIHEYWLTPNPVGKLSHPIYHFSFNSISDQVLRNDRYSTLGAQALFKNHVSFSYIHMVLKPLSKFVETYFLKKGYLDGFLGWTISVSAAYSVFLKWVKLWELEKKDESR